MKIAFLTNSIGFGGAEKMLAFVSNSMVKKGHAVSIINFDTFSDYDNLSKQSFAASIKLYSAPKNIAKTLSFIGKVKYAYTIVKQCRPDALVCFTATPGCIGRIVGLLCGIPSIFAERGNPYITINKHNFHSLVELSILNTSSGAVFQIEGAAKFFSKRLQKRSTIIPNPIYIKEGIQAPPFQERELSVVSVGRLNNAQKRYDIMIKAFKMFSLENPKWVLKIYGAGSDENRIKQWCSDEKISEKVSFMGLTNDPMQEIKNDGIFLITSDYEGISNSLLEAMAVGLPCISTDSAPGGARMLITHKTNGLLVPTNDPSSVANALSMFANDLNLMNKCSENARKIVERFAPEGIIEKWEAYIHQVFTNYNKHSDK